MLFLYPTPQYPRKPIEYIFKGLHMLVMLMHVVSIVVLITDFYLRLECSMPQYYTNSQLVISPGILMVFQDCTYSGSIRLGNVRGESEVGLGNVGYGLMTTAQYVTALFVLEFLLLVNCGVASGNYSTGNRNLRIAGIHVPFYHITVAFSYIYSIAIIVTTWVFQPNRIFFMNAVNYCANQMRISNPSALLEAEYNNFTIFSTAVYWPFGATCFGLLIYFFALSVRAWNSSKAGAVLLSEADVPWEKRGPMCSINKVLLKLHTTQRNAILKEAKEAMEDGGAVRIVRSYQLMTEEDFNKLVQAMKDQVAALLKEEQFKTLYENFGERESQIDDAFAWRQRLMDMPPSQDGDEYMDPYYTDNDMHPGDYAGNVYYSEEPLYPGEGDYNAEGNPGSLKDGEEVGYYDGDGYSPQAQDVGAGDAQWGNDDDYYGTTYGNDEDINAYHEDGSNAVGGGDYEDYNDVDAEAAYPQEEAYPDEDKEGGHSRGRRKHRHRRYRNRDEGVDALEPDPRSPVVAADSFTPSDFVGSSHRSGGVGGDDGASRRMSQRRAGRQAQVEQDPVEGDELSGGDFGSGMGDFY